MDSATTPRYLTLYDDGAWAFQQMPDSVHDAKHMPTAYVEAIALLKCAGNIDDPSFYFCARINGVGSLSRLAEGDRRMYATIYAEFIRAFEEREIHDKK